MPKYRPVSVLIPETDVTKVFPLYTLFNTCLLIPGGVEVSVVVVFAKLLTEFPDLEFVIFTFSPRIKSVPAEVIVIPVIVPGARSTAITASFPRIAVFD